MIFHFHFFQKKIQHLRHLIVSEKTDVSNRSMSEVMITLCQKGIVIEERAYNTPCAFMYFFRFPRTARPSFESPVRK